MARLLYTNQIALTSGAPTVALLASDNYYISNVVVDFLSIIMSTTGIITLQLLQTATPFFRMGFVAVGDMFETDNNLMCRDITLNIPLLRASTVSAFISATAGFTSAAVNLNIYGDTLP